MSQHNTTSVQPQFMQGNEALFRGAVAAGARFYAGYPITPSSEIAQLAAEALPAIGGVYLQMEDEIASIAATLGAALSGVPSFTATSGPGFSLMQENLGFGYMAEVPCVIINVMRSGPSTGLATMPAQADVMQARWGTHGDHPALVLCPATVQECYELSAIGVVWAEQLRMPVIILSDEVIGHLREPVVVPAHVPQASRPKPAGDPADYRTYAPGPDGIPPLASFGDRHIVHANSSMHDEAGLPTTNRATAARLIRRLHDKPLGRPHLTMHNAWYLEDAEWVFISYGVSARAAQEAVDRLRASGIRAGLLQLKTLWPFPEELVLAKTAAAKGVFVVELNLGQVVREVDATVRGRCPVHSICASDGRPLLPRDIVKPALEVVGK